jgi:hypothetical protein
MTAPGTKSGELLADLARVKALFQLRAIVTHLGGNPDAVKLPEPSERKDS